MNHNQVQFPDGHTLLRNLNKNYPVISYGRGIELFDKNGKRYLDAAGGALVVTLGHGNMEIVDEITQQISRVAYVNGMQFTSDVMESFSEKLAAHGARIGLNRVSVLSSGSEAVEAAIKLARQLQVDRGEEKRVKLIARTPGYHGNTLYALSASGRPHYKKLYGPLLSPVLTVSTPQAYRSPVKDYDHDACEHYARELEKLIAKEGAETIFAFIFEPVSGSSTGAALPPPLYFDRVQEICRKNGILMIADEVMCGSGRTDRFFACEHYGLKPDILVLGKGINSGYAPVSAVLVREDDLLTIKNGSGYFMHAQTYMQSPSMAATGLAVLNYLERHHVLERAAPLGTKFQKLLREQLAELPIVGSVSGLGHMAGVEFVQDKDSKKPFDRSEKFVEKFVASAQENGLILWPNVGHVDGTNGDLVMLGPPLTSSESELTEIVHSLAKCVQNSL